MADWAEMEARDVFYAVDDLPQRSVIGDAATQAAMIDAIAAALRKARREGMEQAQHQVELHDVICEGNNCPGCRDASRAIQSLIDQEPMTASARLRKLAALAAEWDQHESGEAPAPLSLFDMQAALREAAAELETLRAREGEMRDKRELIARNVCWPCGDICKGPESCDSWENWLDRADAVIALLTPASPGEDDKVGAM